jgi:hypothetical protein
MGIEVEYCELNNYIYMNGMLICVNTNEYDTQEKLNAKLYDYWWDDFYFGTNDCSSVTEAKHFDLLLLDHIGLIGGYATYYGNLTAAALHDCCLKETDFDHINFNTMQSNINYVSSRGMYYNDDISSRITSIVQQLNWLKTQLENV